MGPCAGSTAPSRSIEPFERPSQGRFARNASSMIMLFAINASKERLMSQAVADVSVVICAYTEDRWADLLAAVELVRRQTRCAIEIVVVVDHHPVLLRRVQASLP